MYDLTTLAQDSSVMLTNPATQAKVKLAVKEVIQAASHVLVVDDESKAGAIAVAKTAKEMCRVIEVQRKSLVTPLNTEVKDINILFKQFTSRLTEAEALGKFAVLKFERKLRQEVRERTDQLERDRLEEERKTRALKETEAGSSAERTEAVQEEFTQEAAEIATIQDRPKTQVHADGLKSTIAKKPYDYRVINIYEVPREWLTVDSNRVKAAIRKKEGRVKYIAGLEIFQEDSLRI